MFDPILHKNIILFDGVCNLCNASVVFVLKRDKKGYFSFASLQSESGKELVNYFGYAPGDKESFLLIEDGKLYHQSTAALRVTRKLKGLWPGMYAFMIIPRFIRDGVYNIIARNRYKWFGKKNECALPLPEWKDRFIG